jgi:cytochrome c556
MIRRTTMLAALGLLALAGAALAQGVAQGGAAGTAEVIAQRRAGLKRMGQHMEAMKPVVEAGGEVKSLEPRIDDMITWFRGLPALFPPGSDVGDTKALPAIWQDFGKFEATDQALLGELAKLKQAAAADDKAGFAAMYKTLGPQYCGTCHRPFRAR